MTMDLKARNKGLDMLTFTVGGWSLLLKTGIGLLLGYMDYGGGQYIFRKDMGDPMMNDGLYVNADTARSMARMLKVFVGHQREVRKFWDELTVVEQVKLKRDLPEVYEARRPRYHPDLLDDFEKGADWMERSMGFWIW